MTDELKAQIEHESNKAARLSREVIAAYETNNKVQGKVLMKEAVAASKNCRKLIEQFNQSTG